MLTCLECAKLRGKPASARFVEVVSEGVCPDCGRTLSRDLMGVRLDAAPKVVLVSSLAVEADIVDGQAKLFRGVADNLLKLTERLDASDSKNAIRSPGDLEAIRTELVGCMLTIGAIAWTMTNHAAALRKASEP